MFLLLAICYFIPPSGWEAVQPKQLSEYVQVGFLGKGSNEFRPSINIAFEEVNVSLKEYIKAVKAIHASQPDAKWRDLGKFSMLAGEGRLTEITSPTPWGEIKTLQAILVKQNQAYILTGACLKQDFPRFQSDLLRCFHSLNLAPDLFSAIPDPENRHALKQLFDSLGTRAEKEEEWQLLQKAVAEKAPQMGGYWHFLLLKEGHAKIYAE